MGDLLPTKVIVFFSRKFFHVSRPVVRKRKREYENYIMHMPGIEDGPFTLLSIDSCMSFAVSTSKNITIHLIACRTYVTSSLVI